MKIYIYLLIFGLAIASLYHQLQPANDYKISSLADANEYEKIYDYFKGDRANYAVRFGIHNRIAIPFLASLLPGTKIADNFFIINSIFALLSLMLLYYVMSMFRIDTSIIIGALIYFSLHWVGPFRQNAIDPINADMNVYFFELVFLLLLIKQKYLLLLILSPFAIASKEIFLAILVVFFVISILWRFLFKYKTISIPWVSGILIIGIITKLVLNYFYPSVSPGRNSIIVMAFHVREMLYNPDHLVRWVLSFFAAFGAFLFLFFKKPVKISLPNSDELLVHFLSLAVLALSVLGGMDYTRLIFLGFPYIIISIVKIGKPKLGEWYLALGLSLLLTRFWMILPDPAKIINGYYIWMPEVADATHLWLWLLTAFLGYVVFIVGRKQINARVKSDQSPE